MKMIFLVVCFFLSSLCSTVYAGGGMTHMYIAEQAIERLGDAQLRHLLWNNLEAYLVGAYYPDSGYIRGSHYGEISHWDPFIYAFADYIKEKYKDPVQQNPKLVAFLFGCAVHRVSDEVTHFTFYNIMKVKDFKGNWNKAHQYGDIGIDLLLNVDKRLWQTHPATWWVPVKDLLEIYKRMGEGPFTAREIINGNIAISLAGYGERLISLPAYPYLKLRMPWTAANYYNWPEGGIMMDVDKVAEYETNLWERLNNKSMKARPMPTFMSKIHGNTVENTPIIEFASAAIKEGVVSLNTQTNADGSVEITQPLVNQGQKLRALLKKLISNLFS